MGRQHAKTRDVLIVIAVTLLVTLLLIYVLIAVWPPPPTSRTAGNGAVRLFGRAARMSLETRLFVIVAVAGALGALIHSLRSLYWYVGNRALRRSWLLMYVSLPFVGAVLGLVVYLVLRGGLTSSVAQSSDVNPYGMAAVAALVGMFSQETSEKLRTVFATLLAPAAAGRDQALPARVVSVLPAEGTAGTVVTLRGVGLASALAVAFGRAEAVAEVVSDNEIRAMVPDGADDGYPIVKTPAGPVISPVEFRVSGTVA
ncbi:IPT/TIG domain-containing protein [Actinomadura sp. DC4]|uniref:IPT/TIG domain-containing protein n=1 Tax=Actinomadura sp. DC4 TaxID=3055069 RepID=UPI0025B12B09|nr:IPT/TIG domain-containing protein [Actinomadura sp. DC4]MDN3353042.1 IPT/TIG domain-containing protein [Actinomadura sp. DC4]